MCVMIRHVLYLVHHSCGDPLRALHADGTSRTSFILLLVRETSRRSKTAIAIGRQRLVLYDLISDDW